MKKIWLPLLALLLSLPLSLPAHAAGHSCGPLPGNEGVYALSWNTDFNECSPWQACWAGYFAKVEAAAKRSPNDVVVGAMYQQMISRLGPEQANAMRERYVARGEKERGNPAAQYLAGLAAVRGDQSLEFFARAVKLDPGFGRAYKEIAQRVFQPRGSQDKKNLETRFGTTEANLVRFMETCPEQPDLILQFTEVGDAKLWAEYLAHGRELIQKYEFPRSPVRGVDALTSLWGIEARLLPAADAKARIAKDVEFLTGFGARQGRSLPVLDGIAAGQHKLSDFKAEELTWDEIVAAFPCSSSAANSALRIKSERYWLAHGGRKSPLGMTPEQARDYYTTVYGWIDACPNRANTYLWSLIPAVYRLGVDGKLTPGELARDEKFVSARWQEIGRFSQTYALQSPDLIFAAIRLRNGQAATANDITTLRRVLRDQARWESNTLLTGWLADSLPKEQELDHVQRAGIDVYVSGLLARALASRGDLAGANQVLTGVASKATLVMANLTNKEVYGAAAALTQYWRGKAATANGWDRYAYLKLADTIQPVTGVDHDPTLPTETSALAAKLGVTGDPLTAWKGSPNGREALAQVAKMGSGETEVVKENVWRTLSAPVPLPAVALKVMGGNTLSLADASKGRTVLVNVWATWCPPCQNELPLLTRVAKQAGQGAIVTISIDSDQGEVEPYLAKRGFALPIVLFGEEYFRDITQNPQLKEQMQWSVPQSWLVRDGKVLAIVNGFDPKVDPEKWVAETLAMVQGAK